MSTRGLFGLRIDNQDKLNYNHSDSYFDGLGDSFMSQVRLLTYNPTLLAQARAIVALPDEHELPVESLKSMLSSGSYHDSNSFIYDSLFCEYAYILNLDTRQVEIYRGFQTNPHDWGRYGRTGRPCNYKSPTTYYGCKLVGTFPMDQIPENWIEYLEGNVSMHEIVNNEYNKLPA